MSDDWNDNARFVIPQVQTQVFTNSNDYGRSNWRDRPQRKYQDKSNPREDRRNGYRGGGNRFDGNRFDGNRAPRRPNDDATIIKVPSKFVGRIIGRGGSKISDLQFESGARINVTKDVEGDETLIRLIGDDEAVSKAESLIRELTIERDNFENRSVPLEQKPPLEEPTFVEPPKQINWRAVFEESVSSYIS